MATSASRIDKENEKRKFKILSIVINIIFALFLFVYSINFVYIWRDTRRPEIKDVLSRSIVKMFTSVEAFFNLTPEEYFVIICLFAFMGCIMLILANTRILRRHDNPETVNGSAKLMDQKELNEYNKRRSDPIGSVKHDGPNNMILSRDIYLSMDGFKSRRNCNILVIGGSGAGKSRFFAAPNILQYNANFIITDPSGELLENYGKALENNGYTVKVFNLVNVYKGNRYNPFHYIKEEKDVFVLVNTLIKNTTPPEGKAGDPFWEKCEKLLLQALILYLWHNVPEEEQTFANIIKLIDMADVDENDASAESKLDRLFNALSNEDPDNLAAQEYRNFKKAAGKTLKSIIISVVARMETFMLSDIQYLTSADEFEFERFADTKQALFVIIPTADTTFNFLVSLMYAQMFMTLYEYVETRAQFGYQAVFGENFVVRVEQATDKADSKRAEAAIKAFVNDIKKGTEIEFDNVREVFNIYTKNSHELITWRGTEEAAQAVQAQLQNTITAKPCRRTCANHVRLILDEFANIGQIPDFNEKLATIRKYNISCSIILQALSQLKKMYKDDWNTIVGNCDTKLFLGSDDQETIEWLVKMLGKRTTTVENLSMQTNSNGTESYNKSSIELLTIDQVAGMGDEECIVRIRGERPYYGLKYDLLAHPNYEEAHKLDGMFTIPESKAAKHKNSHIPLRLRKSQAAAEAAREAEAHRAEITAAKEKESKAAEEKENIEESKASPSVTDSSVSDGKNSDKPNVSASTKKEEPVHKADFTHKKNEATEGKNETKAPFSPVKDMNENSSTPSFTSQKRRAQNKNRKEEAMANREVLAEFDNNILSSADDFAAVQEMLGIAQIPVGASEEILKERAISILNFPEIPSGTPTYKITD